MKNQFQISVIQTVTSGGRVHQVKQKYGLFKG